MALAPGAPVLGQQPIETLSAAELVRISSGFGVGLLVGLTGVGGGALMAPLMLLLFGTAPATAVGTDLWFAAITKMFGALIHGKHGRIDWQIVRRMFVGSLPAAVVTLIWLHQQTANPRQPEVFIQALGLTLVVTSAAALWRARAPTGRHAAPTRRLKASQPLLTVMAGAVVGVLVTLTSIGAGALGALMLLYLYPRRLNSSALVGTDIVHAIPLTLLAGAGHLVLGNVDTALLGTLLIGSVPGIIIGSFAAIRAPVRVIRTVIAVVLAAVGTKMLLS